MAECEDPPPAEVPGRGLVRFADLTEDIDARVEALNSALVPTEVRLTYVEGLDDELRQLAMRVATDVAVLDHWALTGSPTECQIVASNRWTAPGTLCHLTGDPDSEVRAAVAANPRAGIDALAALLDDDSPDVLSALGPSEAMRTHLPAPAEDRPGGEDTFALLHDLVEAAVEIDCLEQLDADEWRRRTDELERRLSVTGGDSPIEAHEDAPDTSSGDEPTPSLWEAMAILQAALGAAEVSEPEAERVWRTAPAPGPEVR